MIALCALVILCKPAQGRSIGDPIGTISATDIVATIFGDPIPSYNMDGNTVIVVEHLSNYGFDVTWLADKRELHVERNTQKTPNPLTIQPPPTHVGGTVGEVLYTDIRTLIEGQVVQSFNIGGNTVIHFDDLAPWGSVWWDARNRVISLTCSSGEETARAEQRASVISVAAENGLIVVAFDKRPSPLPTKDDFKVWYVEEGEQVPVPIDVDALQWVDHSFIARLGVAQFHSGRTGLTVRVACGVAFRDAPFTAASDWLLIPPPPDSPQTTVTPTPPPTGTSQAPEHVAPSQPIGGLHLVANDGTYLGKLTTNKFDVNGIFNEFGTYGNKFSAKSIWNDFGKYGGKFSVQSPFNDFTRTPPQIVASDGRVVGRLTTNSTIPDAISPYVIYAVLLELGL